VYSEWFTRTTEYSTMYHELPRSATFWLFLFSVDQDLAQSAREKACPCGGRLHRANYLRKPRGAEDLPEDYGYRFSFCCARDGCRKCVTPPSVRFLGRKVYLFAVVVLVSAMRQGPSPRLIPAGPFPFPSIEERNGTVLVHRLRTYRARCRLRPTACRDHDSAGTPPARLRACESLRTAMVRLLSLA
jgi:hypothetical protein